MPATSRSPRKGVQVIQFQDLPSNVETCCSHTPTRQQAYISKSSQGRTLGTVRSGTAKIQSMARTVRLRLLTLCGSRPNLAVSSSSDWPGKIFSVFWRFGARTCFRHVCVDPQTIRTGIDIDIDIDIHMNRWKYECKDKDNCKNGYRYGCK